MKYLITISREFGCGARNIGQKLADKLGIRFYDRDLVEFAANQAGIDVEILKKNDESINKAEFKFFSQFSYGASPAFYSDDAIQTQISVIRQIADRNESCVIFGRCSDYVLSEYPNCLKVFLYSSWKYRVEHISKCYSLTEKEAGKMIKKIDKKRHNYYKYVTGKNRGDRYTKDILIDVESFGEDGTVDLLYNIIKKKFNQIYIL